jgi:phage N-6-adenine-methyltransferase
MAILRLERGNARIATLSAVVRVLAPKVRVARNVSVRVRWATNYIRGRTYQDRDRRFTPGDVLERIYAVIGEIDLDPAADRDAGVVARRYFNAEDDGLTRPWDARTVFCNPPFSKATPFIRKALNAWSKGECKVALLLLPARTHQSAFQEAIAGHADVFFLRRRMNFGLPNGGQVEFFGTILALYGADEEMIERMMAAFDCVHLPRRAAAIGQRR